MKWNVPTALFLVAGIIVTCPRTLPAKGIEEQYKHASELLWAGELKQAQSGFEAVLQRKPNYRSAKVLLGLTLARLSAQSEENGDRPGAISQLRAALRLDPEEAYWHTALAKLLHAEGNTEEAAEECAQAGRLSPEDSDLARGCGFGASPEIAKDNTIPKVSGPGRTEVTPPAPEHRPEPPYSEKARAARLQGTVVMLLTVGAHGEVEQVAVKRPLGLGLDESALRTVRTWKFRPATLNNAPTPVRIILEVSFRLF